MADGIPHARVASRPYAGGKYGIYSPVREKWVPLKRPFGSVTAAYNWLERSNYYIPNYEVRPWAEYQASEKES